MAELIREKKLRFDIPSGQKKERIDVYLSAHIENATRSKVQKLIEAKLVKVNGKFVKPSYKVLPDDIIEAVIPISPRPEETEPEDIPLNIVYEDEYLIVVNKPAGMVAHPAFSNYTGTLVNALLHHTKYLSELNEPGRPGIVHRLDKDTSGLLVVAKDDWTHAQLAKQFSKHTIEREYWAIVWGKFKQRKGEIDTFITRSKKDRKKFTASSSEGKHAVTLYEVLEEYEFASLLKINLKTGRTHQIRVHLSSINHPVFGDPTYGGREIVYGANLPKMVSRTKNLLDLMPRQALHAKTLGFIHPHKKEFMRFDSELPEDMLELIKNLKGKTNPVS
ncbi:MAG: RNA pseudouridine synthase [Ignavibacteria bacterium RIFOXYB2_FULL_35_12]|nr:MAG: RNA pseudouridine synthase [Ignavibacteria bacterium GWA2_36_19]OGU50187.1 MAG: RNA pseudouridine synthase [Ignavibacteria bacterium GWC2_35_8]OGU60390.1 MAG: RNA pseudouridine synthase [Ignavibacteria bacterium GWF2_35_20]OGU78251.1 MAG: RNA pseudouridine synthase [Ignavibacteria bacterium RIFOXYA2_FULL_35_9]OGU84288.1 MAG: RNA pseudouridine synthase [Ignavibacteria bacterium RIFOXYA12_FULL_35_25]OGU95962.1 MAG: RNA pseudouridine synthase [Ignavibacteria bacterium RIFOXYB12_FULL_35_14